MPGFQDIVQGVWGRQVNHVDPYHILFHKMENTSQALKKWSKTIFAHSKVQVHMALEVILRLDEAQDSRPLSADECDLCRRLKHKVLVYLCLSVPEKGNVRESPTSKLEMPTPIFSSPRQS